MQGVGVEQQELSRPGNPEQCAEHVAEFSVHGAGVWSICPLLRPPLMTVTRGNPPSPHTYFISPDLPGCTAVQVKAILGVGEGSGQNTESCAVCLCVCVCVCVCTVSVGEPRLHSTIHSAHLLLKSEGGEFPGGPVVRTPCFHCWGPGFKPWSGN